MFGMTGVTYDPRDPKANLRTAAGALPMVAGIAAAPFTEGMSIPAALATQAAVGGGSRAISNALTDRPIGEDVILDTILGAGGEAGGRLLGAAARPTMKSGLAISDEMRGTIGSDKIADLALQKNIVRGEPGEATAAGLRDVASAAKERFLADAKPVASHDIPGQVRKEVQGVQEAQYTAGFKPDKTPKVIGRFEKRLPPQMETVNRLSPEDAATFHPQDAMTQGYSPVRVQPAPTNIPAPLPAKTLDTTRKMWGQMANREGTSELESQALRSMAKKADVAMEAVNPGYQAANMNIRVPEALRRAIGGTIHPSSALEELALPYLAVSHPGPAAVAKLASSATGRRALAVGLNRAGTPAAAITRAALVRMLNSGQGEQ